MKTIKSAIKILLKFESITHLEGFEDLSKEQQDCLKTLSATISNEINEHFSKKKRLPRR